LITYEKLALSPVIEKSQEGFNFPGGLTRKGLGRLEPFLLE